MSLSIFEYGDGRFRLFHGDREVGWVDARTLGFVGWESERAAHRAATVAYDALSVWLARQRRLEAPPRRGRPLCARTEGGQRQLTLGSLVIGKLVAQTDDQRAGQHGFELTLPPRIGAALTAAHVVDAALTRHHAVTQLERVAAAAAAVPDALP